MKALLSSCSVLGVIGLALGWAPLSYAQKAQNDQHSINAAKPYANFRYRFEQVEQSGFTQKANASTLRAKLGIISGNWNDFSVQLEGEGNVMVGAEDFNDTVNGKSQYPVVADPPVALINQAVLRWSRDGRLSTSVGRQTVNLGNQRWIGSVGFRQNDQTLDAALVTMRPSKALKVLYGYSWQVNRIFGPDSSKGTWSSNAVQMFNARYQLGKIGSLLGYAYLLDIPQARQVSTQTYGIRMSGVLATGPDLRLTYALAYARQSAYGSNPHHFNLGYTLFEPGISFRSFSGKLGLERLDGNGAIAVQTPLATLHKFNGWADVFLNTPVNGLADRYIKGKVSLSGPDWLRGSRLQVIYHDFYATRGGLHYGSEWDTQLARSYGKHLTLAVTYANYRSKGYARNTRKLWLSAVVKL